MTSCNKIESKKPNFVDLLRNIFILFYFSGIKKLIIRETTFAASSQIVSAKLSFAENKTFKCLLHLNVRRMSKFEATALILDYQNLVMHDS